MYSTIEKIIKGGKKKFDKRWIFSKIKRAWSDIGMSNRSKKFRLFYDYIATPIGERY